MRAQRRGAGVPRLGLEREIEVRARQLHLAQLRQAQRAVHTGAHGLAVLLEGAGEARRRGADEAHPVEHAAGLEGDVVGGEEEGLAHAGEEPLAQAPPQLRLGERRRAHRVCELQHRVTVGREVDEALPPPAGVAFVVRVRWGTGRILLGPRGHRTSGRWARRGVGVVACRRRVGRTGATSPQRRHLALRRERVPDAIEEARQRHAPVQHRRGHHEVARAARGHGPPSPAEPRAERVEVDRHRRAFAVAGQPQGPVFTRVVERERALVGDEQQRRLAQHSLGGAEEGEGAGGQEDAAVPEASEGGAREGIERRLGEVQAARGVDQGPAAWSLEQRVGQGVEQVRAAHHERLVGRAGERVAQGGRGRMVGRQAPRREERRELRVRAPRVDERCRGIGGHHAQALVTAREELKREAPGASADVDDAHARPPEALREGVRRVRHDARHGARGAQPKRHRARKRSEPGLRVEARLARGEDLFERSHGLAP